MIRRTTPRSVVACRRLPFEISIVLVAKVVLLTMLWALCFRSPVAVDVPDHVYSNPLTTSDR